MGERRNEGYEIAVFWGAADPYGTMTFGPTEALDAVSALMASDASLSSAMVIISYGAAAQSLPN